MLTNPETGKTLAHAIDSEALHPGNNLADVRSIVTALENVGITAYSVTVTALAGAANVSTVTVSVVDYAGNVVPGVFSLLLWTSSDAAGTTVSATAYSGSLVATTGTILTTETAKHVFEIITASSGVFVGSLTDTAKTADYIAVRGPLNGKIVVSAAAAFGA